ncbi:HERC6 [Symbiodinium sp. CCMP2456]|nr:HERC6 [Symbiodinium sp. CCMP2456]
MTSQPVATSEHRLALATLPCCAAMGRLSFSEAPRTASARCRNYPQVPATSRSDGAAVAFGDNSAGQCDLPEGRGYVGAAAGRTHAVLLREDGSAVAWGLKKSGSCTVPSLPEGVRYIEAAAGGDHTVLIRDDGQAVAFGHNGAGQCELPPLPEGLRYVSCAAGWTHTVLLRDDGLALCVGGNGRGQCNIPQGLANNCVAIAAGGAHTLLLCSDGRAVIFGDDKCGQCAPPDISENLGCVASATARAVLVATLGIEEDTLVARCASGAAIHAPGLSQESSLAEVRRCLASRLRVPPLLLKLVKSDGSLLDLMLDDKEVSELLAEPATWEPLAPS